MNKSAGIIPYRIKNNRVEFFVGHPGGPLWQKQNYYAFLKGKIEEGEDSWIAASREFMEESGIELPLVDYIGLGSIKQNSKKSVYAFAANFDIDTDKCFSNECEIEFPLKSGNKIKIPEIDKYAWFSYDELKEITNKHHLPFYESIIKMVRNEEKYHDVIDENGNSIEKKK